jgi:hypothetical protein
VPPGPADRPLSDTDDTWNLLPSTLGIGEPGKSRQTAPGIKETEKTGVRWFTGCRGGEGHLKYTHGSGGAVLCPSWSLTAQGRTRSIIFPSSDVLGFGRGRKDRAWYF